MSTGRSSVIEALPHASILNYFRRPPARQQRGTSLYYETRPPPPPYSATCARTPPLPQIPEAESEDSDCEIDEESRLGFCTDSQFHNDHRSSDGTGAKEENDGGYGCGFYEIISFACYTLLILSLVLNLDTFFSQLAVGDAKYTSTPQDMMFCLESQDRDVPVSRIWRYMAPLSTEQCSTQVATLTAESTSAWRFQPDDKFLLEDDTVGEHIEMEKVKFIGTGQEKTTDANDPVLGDDFSEEGELIQRRKVAVLDGSCKQIREIA